MEVKKLSVSSLQLYEQCPLKYKLTYGQEERYDADTEHFVFGNVLHKALERWVRPNETKSLLNIYNEECLNFKLVDKDYILAGINIVKEFEEKHKKQNIKLFIRPEFRFNLNIENLFILSGVIDRVDLLDRDKRYIKLIDYKSSFIQEDDLTYNLQLLVYCYVLKKLFPKYKVVRASHYYLRYNDEKNTYYTDEQIDNIYYYLITMYYLISNDETFEPKLNRYCPWCDFKNGCEAYQNILLGNKLLKDIDENNYETVYNEYVRLGSLEKIISKRREELNNILMEVFEHNKNIVLSDKTLYLAGGKRENYDLDFILDLVPKNELKDVLAVRKSEVDKKYGNNKEIMNLLQKAKHYYMVKPTIRYKKN